MLPPRSWKAATAANATSAAATAYSDNSRPVSSFKNLLITNFLLTDLESLFNCVRQRVDLGADVAAQKLESCDGCQSYERCGDGVLRQFKTCFIAKESLNHFVCSFRV